MHERVKGVREDGVPYDAMDPRLLLWVWATLVDVSLLVYDAAVAPLSDDERERYYDEQKLVAYACGVPEGGCPATYADFVAYFNRTIDDDLVVTDVARLVAYAGRNPPLPRPLGRVGGALGSFFTAALLPGRFRAPLGYEWSPARERVLRALFFLSRLAARITPARLRHVQNTYLIHRRTPLGWWRDRAIDVPEDLKRAG
jgi:uncharacterized protein (DUF2236 family)